MAKCCGQENYKSNQRPKNDRRLQLIDGIRQYLEDCENQERNRTTGGQQTSGRPQISGIRNMDEECLRYRKRRECSPPTITSLGSREIRPTSNYDAMKYESSKQVTYVDGSSKPDPFDPMPSAPWELPRTPSQELRAGNLYTSCDCRKRNGLQLDCPRWECGGRPECLAVNPGPCCVASKARKPVRGDRRYRTGGGGGDQSSGIQKQQHCDFQENALKRQQAEEAATLCLCAPVGMKQSPPRQQYGAPGEVVGIVTVSSPGPQQRVMTPPPGAGGMVCFCQAPSSKPQTPAQPQPTKGEFVITSPAGMKFLCCPLPQ